MDNSEFEKLKEVPFKLDHETLSKILSDNPDSWRFVRQGDDIFVSTQNAGNHKEICEEANLDAPEDGGYFQTAQNNSISLSGDVSNGLDLHYDVSEKTQITNRPKTIELFNGYGKDIDGFEIIFTRRRNA